MVAKTWAKNYLIKFHNLLRESESDNSIKTEFNLDGTHVNIDGHTACYNRTIDEGEDATILKLLNDTFDRYNNPIVVITNWNEDDVTMTEPISVEWTANGVVQPPVNKTLTEGSNAVTVQYTNEYGRVGEATVNIIYDPSGDFNLEGRWIMDSWVDPVIPDQTVRGNDITVNGGIPTFTDSRWDTNPTWGTLGVVDFFDTNKDYSAMIWVEKTGTWTSAKWIFGRFPIANQRKHGLAMNGGNIVLWVPNSEIVIQASPVDTRFLLSVVYRFDIPLDRRVWDVYVNKVLVTTVTTVFTGTNDLTLPVVFGARDDGLGAFTGLLDNGEYWSKAVDSTYIDNKYDTEI
jgi:hypothetical protein